MDLAPGPRARTTYEPGQVLPGTVYRIVRHLATGGMGTVYEVEDTSVEKRYVLKTLHPQLIAREDLARRMRDEAKSLAKLEHPNIVAVITAGVTTDALKMPFYVMERLVGQNLRVVLQKKRAIELAPAVRVAIDVLDALEHAHENAIVHRDVKPENIFLHRNANGTTTTKLLDFGIVRLLDRTAGETSGKFIGTLRYASPEQVTGTKIDHATDLYSLGLVLYEMLVGRGPFDDVGDAYAIGVAQVNQAPPSLGAFALAPLPPDLERLVMSAIAKDPSSRPRDAFTFATELRRILRAEESRSSATATTTAAPSSAGATSVDYPPEDAGPVSPVAPTVAAEPAERIDRAAATRTSSPGGSTQRLPAHDTRMEEALPASAELPALRPAAGAPIVTPIPHVATPVQNLNPTAPPAALAKARAPERGGVVLVAAAAGVVALSLLVGAVVVARHRLAKAPEAVTSAPSGAVAASVVETPAAVVPTEPGLSASARGVAPVAPALASASEAPPALVVSATAASSARPTPAVPRARGRGEPAGSPPRSPSRAPEVTFDP